MLTGYSSLKRKIPHKHIVKLREFRRSEYYELLQEVADRVIEFDAEALLGSTDPSEDAILKGEIRALRKLFTVIDQILTKHARETERERERARTDSRIDFFGTRFFGS